MNSGEMSPLAAGQYVAYGLGSVGTGLYFSVPGILLLFYMTDLLGVAAPLAAGAIFLPKLVGALIDPAAGYLSDGTRSPWGRRLPWMLPGGVVISLCLYALFAVPFTGAAAFAWILVFYLVSSLAYSAYAVPYLAIPAEVTACAKERSLLISTRMVMSMSGVLVGSAFAPWLVQSFGGGRAGYQQMGLVICVIGLLAFAGACYFAYRHSPAQHTAARQVGLLRTIRQVFGNSDFRFLVVVFVLQTLAASGFSAMLPYVVVRVWGGNESLVGMLMLSLLLASMLGMYLWHRVGTWLGKYPALAFSVGTYALVLLLFIALPSQPSVPVLAVLFAVAGASFAGTQLLPFALVADEIFASSIRTGERSEAVFTGVWTACEKLGLSLGAPMAALVLVLSGYREAVAGEVVEQSGHTLNMIYAGFVAIPLVAQLLSLVLLFVQRQRRRRAAYA